MSRNMSDPDYQALKETNWRRKLSPAEEAALRKFLATNGPARAEWEKETALNQLLTRLPDVPISSNFTARVLDAARREQATQKFEQLWPDWWRNLGWIPRLAGVCLILGATALSIHEYQEAQLREMARDVEKVSTSALVSKIDWLENFDTIKRLNQVPPVDEELLTALK